MLVKIGGNEYHCNYINQSVCSDGNTLENNEATFIIGHGRWAFDIELSRCNGSSIWLYRDPYNIDSIAVAKGIHEINQIENTTFYNRSQRTLNLNEGEVAILQNIYGFWAAIKIRKIQDKNFGSPNDLLVIDYKIQTMTYHGPGVFPYSFLPNAFPPPVQEEPVQEEPVQEELESGSRGYVAKPYRYQEYKSWY